jgi:hypothetical protein
MSDDQKIPVKTELISKLEALNSQLFIRLPPKNSNNNEIVAISQEIRENITTIAQLISGAL